MRLKWLSYAASAALVAGCSTQAIKPAEVLDERTGMTVGALQEPIEFVQNMQVSASVSGKRASFAYLGPVEWDQAGHISYGLWLNVAPGNDRQASDLHAPQTVSLSLDDGLLALSYIDPPEPGSTPYRPVVSWGQSAYFELTADLLKRLAASRKMELRIGTTDGTSISYTPSQDTHATFSQFIRARGITDD